MHCSDCPYYFWDSDTFGSHCVYNGECPFVVLSGSES